MGQLYAAAITGEGACSPGENLALLWGAACTLTTHHMLSRHGTAAMNPGPSHNPGHARCHAGTEQKVGAEAQMEVNVYVRE